MRHQAFLLCALLAAGRGAAASAQASPPWSSQGGLPARDRGYVFQVPDIDNVPDLQGNPVGAKLVRFIGGNKFFVLTQLIQAFEAYHPEVAGHVIY